MITIVVKMSLLQDMSGHWKQEDLSGQQKQADKSQQQKPNDQWRHGGEGGQGKMSGQWKQDTFGCFSNMGTCKFGSIYHSSSD